MHEMNQNICRLPKIHHLVEQQAERNPTKTAIILNGQRITYGELNAKANQLARYLIENGVGSGDIVPIISVKSPKTFIAILGILKAGAAYSPLNSGSPEKHIKAVIRETKASIFCADDDLIDQFALSDIPAINLDNLEEQIRPYSEENLDDVKEESDLAYVIYTSGTTGNPKGGMVAHANLLPTYHSWKEAYKLTSADVHLQMAPVGFDVFAGDWMRALCSGATLVLCPNNVLLDSEKLYQLIKQEKVTCAEFVPSTLRKLVGFVLKNNDDLKQFRLLVCGSDQWTMREYRLVKKLCGENSRVISSYGVTETTIDSSFYEESLEKSMLADDSVVPIGTPFNHVNIYLVDDDGNLLSADAMGEIYIGGLGVGLGYLNQPELTRDKFVERNFNGVMEKLYRTGDQGKRLADENRNILFLGRNQEHVKIEGKRVDLPSLEHSVAQHKKIKFCMVTPTEKSGSNEVVLKCFVMLNDDSLTFEELAHHIRSELPCYYVPRELYQIDEISLSVNGKVDKRVIAQKIVKQIKPDIIAPENAVEEYLIGIWQEILGVQEVGTTNSFYELGGSSLSLVSMLEKVNQKFNTNILPSVEFETIKELSNHVISQKSAEKRQNIDPTILDVPVLPNEKNVGSVPRVFSCSREPAPRRWLKTSLGERNFLLPPTLPLNPRKNFCTFFKPPLKSYPLSPGLTKTLVSLIFRR